MTVLFSHFATILLDLWAFLGYTIDIDDETLTACLREDSGFFRGMVRRLQDAF